MLFRPTVVGDSVCIEKNSIARSYMCAKCVCIQLFCQHLMPENQIGLAHAPFANMEAEEAAKDLDPPSDGDLTSCSAEWTSDEDKETEMRLRILLRDAFQATGPTRARRRRTKQMPTPRRTRTTFAKFIRRLRPPRQEATSIPEAHADRAHEAAQSRKITSPIAW